MGEDVNLLKINDNCGFTESSGDRVFVGSLGLEEKAAQETPVSTTGEIWLRNDALQTPMFTDEAGSDFELLGLAKDILFGGGSDGTFSSSGDLTLVRDGYYLDFTVNNGDDVFLNGNILYVCGTLTINSGGRIVVFGNDGSAGSAGFGGVGGSGGAGGSAGTPGQSTDMFTVAPTGASGGTSPAGLGGAGTTPSGQNGAGGAGAGGGAGGTSIGGGGAGSSGSTITLYKFESLTDLFHVWDGSSGGFIVIVGGTPAGSGGGGGSGATPGLGAGGGAGGGGTGAGWCIIFCKVFINNGEIRADGGSGGAGGAGEFGGGFPTDDGAGAGGGGGGGGGKVYIVACDFDTVGTINVSGGTGGAAGPGGGAAPPGTAGSDGADGCVTRINVKDGTITIT